MLSVIYTLPCPSIPLLPSVSQLVLRDEIPPPLSAELPLALFRLSAPHSLLVTSIPALTSVMYPAVPTMEGTKTTYAKVNQAVRRVQRKYLWRLTVMSVCHQPVARLVCLRLYAAAVAKSIPAAPPATPSWNRNRRSCPAQTALREPSLVITPQTRVMSGAYCEDGVASQHTWQAAGAGQIEIRRSAREARGLRGMWCETYCSI